MQLEKFKEKNTKKHLLNAKHLHYLKSEITEA